MGWQGESAINCAHPLEALCGAAFLIYIFKCLVKSASELICVFLVHPLHNTVTQFSPHSCCCSCCKRWRSHAYWNSSLPLPMCFIHQANSSGRDMRQQLPWQCLQMAENKVALDRIPSPMRLLCYLQKLPGTFLPWIPSWGVGHQLASRDPRWLQIVDKL